jgi:hypothetical protein
MNMSMIKLSNQADSSGKSLMISHYHPSYTLSTKMQARDEMDNEERNIIGGSLCKVSLIPAFSWMQRSGANA